MRYNKEQLIGLAGEFRTDASNLTQTHDALKQQVTALCSTWQGAAQTAYQEKQRKWDQAHEELVHVLQTVAKVVEDGAINMGNTDDKNATAWL